MEKQKRIISNIVLIGLVSLFIDMSTEMVYPLIPLYLTAALGATPAIVGVIEGIAESIASLLKVLSGYIGDVRRNKKKLIFAGYAAAAQGSRIACYTPLFGSTPAGFAFDLAAGALMLKAGLVYPTLGASGCDFPAQVAPPGPLGAAGISCLGLAEEEGYGVVELGRTGL